MRRLIMETPCVESAWFVCEPGALSKGRAKRKGFRFSFSNQCVSGFPFVLSSLRREIRRPRHFIELEFRAGSPEEDTHRH